jgi:hypothetical protein
MKKIKAQLTSELFLLETKLYNIVMKYGINSNECYKIKSEVNPRIAELKEEISLIEKKEEENKWM